MTIADIAARAGLSKGAVSYALNGLPGVSERTRRRVEAIALELDWAPSQAARNLVAARADAVGLVLARPAALLGTEPFYMELIAGMEEVLSPSSISLMLHVAPDRQSEMATHRRWWRARQVDAVLLVDLTVDDERVPALAALGLPTVALASPEAAGGFTCVWTDDAAAMQGALRYLAALGHRRVARVAGPPALVHVRDRTEAMRSAAAELGMSDADLPVVSTDFTGEGGAGATRQLLTGAAPPSAIVYDNDIMAVAGLAVAAELGIGVPAELSLLAWDDSALCRITHPALSAMGRDVRELGRNAATRVLEVIAGAAPAPHRGQQAEFRPRGSTGPAPGRLSGHRDGKG